MENAKQLHRICNSNTIVLSLEKTNQEPRVCPPFTWVIVLHIAVTIKNLITSGTFSMTTLTNSRFAQSTTLPILKMSSYNCEIFTFEYFNFFILIFDQKIGFCKPFQNLIMFFYIQLQWPKVDLSI